MTAERFAPRAVRRNDSPAAGPAAAARAAASGFRTSFERRAAALFWVLVLALGVAGAQMAGFGQEHVHIDEHPFILMSAHVLDGGLPNVGLVDIKPPLFFYLLAGAFALFGETLAVARLFGDLSVFVMCVATFGIARRWTGPVEAGLGALLVVAATAGTLGQATLTDFPAMALLMASLWAALAGRRRPWLAGCAGFLASAAVLVRLNLWASAAAMGAWLAFCAWGRSRRLRDGEPHGPELAPRTGGRSPGAHGWTPFLAFSAAALALPSLFVLLYWRADALPDLRFSMIDLPLSYSAQKSVTDQIESLFTWVPRILLDRRPILTVVFAVGATAGVVAALQRLRRRPFAPHAAGRDDDLLLALMAGAFGAALLTAGAMNDQYVFWCVPVGAVYAARGAERAIALAKGWPISWPARMSRMIAAAAFAVVAGLLASALRERATQPRPVQPVRLAAEAIAADWQPGDGVWPLDRPIASWYLEEDSPIPLPYPWNLRWPAMMRPLLDSGRLPAQFLRAAMEEAPAYLLLGRTPDRSVAAGLGSDDGGLFRLPGFFYDHDAAEATRLAQWVQDNYALFYDAHGVAVYKARDRS